MTQLSFPDSSVSLNFCPRVPEEEGHPSPKRRLATDALSNIPLKMYCHTIKGFLFNIYYPLTVHFVLSEAIKSSKSVLITITAPICSLWFKVWFPLHLQVVQLSGWLKHPSQGLNLLREKAAPTCHQMEVTDFPHPTPQTGALIAVAMVM